MRHHHPYILLLLGASLAHAAPPNFDDHIRPIFENSCTNCHNPDKQKGDLDLTTFSAAMRGGSGGKFAEPGEGGDSKIYGVITHTLKPVMPPKGEKLGKKETDLIRAWIDGGMLENKSGKPQRKKKATFALKATPSVGKPKTISLPKHLLLEPVVTTSRASVVADMASSPWAPVLALTGQRQVLLYHTDSLQLTGVLPFDHGQPQSLSFHPSGKYLLAGGGVGGKSGTTLTWDIETGKKVLRAGKDFDSVLAASLRADLGGVSLGGPGKRVKLWDTASDQQLVSIKKHTDWVTRLAYSPDGVLLASGGRGGGVYVWEADTGNEFHNLRGHKAAITDMAWRSDSNLLASVSEDGSMMVWEMNNGKQVKKLTAHKGGVLSLDWTQNGHLVTSGRDQKVKIWKPNFSLLKELPKFSNLITEVAFSYDGKRVFAADWSGVVTVWDAATAKQVGTIAANPPSIATRIKSIQDAIRALPGKLSAAEKALKAATDKSTAAKQNLTTIVTSHRNAVAKHKQLLAERTKLDEQLKTYYAKGKELGSERQQKQQQLAKARDDLNQCNASVAAARKDHQQVENEVRKMVEHEKRLAVSAEKARESAEAKPDDPRLKERAAKAKAALDSHRQLLAKKRKLSQQASTTVTQLSNQQKGPGNRLAAAEKARKELDAIWTDHQAKRKPLQDIRNAINKPISNMQQLARSLEQKIKPARETFKKLEAAQQKAAEDLAQTQQQKNMLEGNLKHWQAAAINTEAIRLDKAAAKLAAEQALAMDAYTALATEIQQLKDPAKLSKKSSRLSQLRRQIDRTAPTVLSLARKAAATKSTYLKTVAD